MGSSLNSFIVVKIGLFVVEIYKFPHVPLVLEQNKNAILDIESPKKKGIEKGPFAL